MTDVKELIEYMNYVPYLSTDFEPLLDNILITARSYLESDDIEQIVKAYEFAKKAHEGQFRLSGEPYLVHILRSTQFLLDIHPDIESIQWCLLHDVIEDCDISAETIKQHFGETVMKLCQWVTKVSSLKYRGEERQIETLKKTFFAMSEDLRVIFIKLADRIHNIQTLAFHPKPEKQKRIADETIEIYIPIAERLGLNKFQYLLENGCFRILHPTEYNQIISYLNKPIFYRSAERWVMLLTKILSDDGLENFSIKGRLKSPFSIYKKLTQKIGEFDIKKINDILAFRIIVDGVPNCYLAMGIVHNTYTPLVHKIKDYIVVPKPNGYQSIHSIILGMFAFPVEIQIRSFEMDRYAELGVAAHFSYKEVGYKKSKTFMADARQTQWVTKLQDIVKSYQDDNELFKQEMKIELLDDNIFVYTPKGEIIEMKKGASVLDFAFRVHSEVGLRFKNALVNGSIVPIDFSPGTGDIITINTWKNQYSANAWWIDVLKTAGARNQLNKYLKSKVRDQLISKSVQNLNARLLENKLPQFKSDDCLIRKEMEKSEEELESKLLEMLDKWWYGSFINVFYKTSLSSGKVHQVKSTSAASPSIQQIIVDWQHNFDCIICPECSKLGTQIIAKSSKEWIKIHHIGCKALNTIGYEKLISAQFEGDPKPLYHFSLKLQITHVSGNLNKVLQILSSYNMNIQHIAFLDTSGNCSIGHITLEMTNPSKVNFILKEFAKYGTVIVVKEKKFI